MPPLPGPGYTPPEEEKPESGTSPVFLAVVVIPVLAAAYYFLTKPPPAPSAPVEVKGAPAARIAPADPMAPPVEARPDAKAPASSLDMFKGNSEGLMQDERPQESPQVKAMAPTPSAKKAGSAGQDKKKAQLKTIDKSGTGNNWNWQH
jgi:hypothetical protein